MPFGPEDNSTLDAMDELRAFRREDIVLNSLKDVTPDEIDLPWVLSHGYGGLWKRQAPVGLQDRIKDGRTKLEFWSDRLKMLGAKGLPIDHSQHLFRGWQEIYFTERLIHGHTLDY